MDRVFVGRVCECECECAQSNKFTHGSAFTPTLDFVNSINCMPAEHSPKQFTHKHLTIFVAIFFFVGQPRLF